MTTKPATLLRQMADRQGQRITARDAVALRMAASVIEQQAAEITRNLGHYGDALRELVQARADRDALRQSITAALEVTA